MSAQAIDTIWTLAFSILGTWVVVFFFYVGFRGGDGLDQTPLRLLGRATLKAAPFLALAPSISIGFPPQGKWWVAGGCLAVFYLTLALTSLVCERESRVLMVVQLLMSFLILMFTVQYVLWQTERAFPAIPHVHQVEGSPCQPIDSTALVAHLSDLHLVRKGQTKTRDGSDPGNGRIDALIDLVNKAHPQFLVVSGDITDSGDDLEWRFAIESLQRISASTKIILSPGNHDLSRVFGPNEIISKGDTGVDVGLRVPRFLDAQWKLNNMVMTALGQNVQALMTTAKPKPDLGQLRAAAAAFNSCASTCEATLTTYRPPSQYPGVPNPQEEPAYARKLRCASQCEGRWRSNGAARIYEEWTAYWNEKADYVFPLSMVSADSRVALIAMMPRAQGTTGENAIGMMDPKELERLRKLLPTLPADLTQLFFVYHHPITRLSNETDATPSEECRWFNLGECIQKKQDSLWWSNTFLRHDPEQATKILNVIDRELERRPNTQGYFLFGHRHRISLGQRNRLIFVEAPNAASNDGGIYLIAGEPSKPGAAPFPMWCKTQ